jgi:hypothetical protein
MFMPRFARAVVRGRNCIPPTIDQAIPLSRIEAV